MDQRGLLRPNDNPDILNATGGDGSDIGAHEVQFPLAGTVTISGRVIFAGGIARSRGLVTLTDGTGNVRYSTVNPFGRYQFPGVPLGRAFTVGLMSKNWSVQPLMIFIAEPLTNFDLTAVRSP